MGERLTPVNSDIISEDYSKNVNDLLLATCNTDFTTEIVDPKYSLDDLKTTLGVLEFHNRQATKRRHLKAEIKIRERPERIPDFWTEQRAKKFRYDWRQMQKLFGKGPMAVFAILLAFAFALTLTLPTQAKAVKTGSCYIEMQDPDTALYVKPVKKSTVIRVPDKVIRNGYIIRIIGIKKLNLKKVKKVYLGKNVFIIPKNAFKGYKGRIYAYKKGFTAVKKAGKGKHKLIRR